MLQKKTRYKSEHDTSDGDFFGEPVFVVQVDDDRVRACVAGTQLVRLGRVLRTFLPVFSRILLSLAFATACVTRLVSLGLVIVLLVWWFAVRVCGRGGCVCCCSGLGRQRWHDQMVAVLLRDVLSVFFCSFLHR